METKPKRKYTKKVREPVNENILIGPIIKNVEPSPIRQVLD